MFKPINNNILTLAKLHPKTIKELNTIFNKATNIYIDFANIVHWSEKLKWHIDLKRLKQLLDSFDQIKLVRFYNGTLQGDKISKHLIRDARKLGYAVTTKPVKKMKISIDVSGIPKDSNIVLKNFIKKPLLRMFTGDTIENLNSKLSEFNKRGIMFLEQWKCNFDVEIAKDMFLDSERNGIKNFILWSGDSDFADLVTQLVIEGKRVTIFGTARRISPELSETGVLIYEIWKLKDFICWSRETRKNAKGTH